MTDTAEIRARHTPHTWPTGYTSCNASGIGGAYPCDAIRLCDALDEARAEVQLAQITMAVKTSATITEQAAEIDRLRAERNHHAKQVIRQAAEIERLRGDTLTPVGRMVEAYRAGYNDHRDGYHIDGKAT